MDCDGHFHKGLQMYQKLEATYFLNVLALASDEARIPGGVRR
jgi:hypothetical protein